MSTTDFHTVTIYLQPHDSLDKVISEMKKIGEILHFEVRPDITNSRTKIATFNIDSQRKPITHTQSRPPNTDTSLTLDYYGPNIANLEEYHFEEHGLRLFCQIPVDGLQIEREKLFFLHFKQFGPMNYYQIIRDQQGNFYLGYVCYFYPANAARALLFSDPKYKAVWAIPRKISKEQQTLTLYERQTYHPLCGRLIDSSIYPYHQQTCQKLYNLSKEFINPVIQKAPVVYRNSQDKN